MKEVTSVPETSLDPQSAEKCVGYVCCAEAAKQIWWVRFIPCDLAIRD